MDSLKVIQSIENNILTEVSDVGPRISSSESFSFRNNSISGENCGLNFYGGVGSYVPSELSNNTVNSKPLGFIVDQNSLTLSNITYGQLILMNCNNIVIDDIEITNTSIGIFIYESNYVNITNTTVESCYNGFILTRSEQCIISEIMISDCSNIGLYVLGDSIHSYLSGSVFKNNSVGVYISSSDLCVIENNTLYNNGDGLRIYYSDYVITHNNTFIGNTNRGLQLSGMNQGCNVTYNLFQDNVGYAIEISTTSKYHIIHHNAFIGNNLGGTSQAMDRAGESIWYDDLALAGNFWNNWSGTGSYQIDWETINVVDPYPLVSNPLS
ncbi:MAG: NosD domain-containing protein [Candidatus Heimdallarchaeaceae archaeon]